MPKKSSGVNKSTSSKKNPIRKRRSTKTVTVKRPSKSKEAKRQKRPERVRGIYELDFIQEDLNSEMVSYWEEKEAKDIREAITIFQKEFLELLTEYQDQIEENFLLESKIRHYKRKLVAKQKEMLELKWKRSALHQDLYELEVGFHLSSKKRTKIETLHTMTNDLEELVDETQQRMKNPSQLPQKLDSRVGISSRDSYASGENIEAALLILDGTIGGIINLQNILKEFKACKEAIDTLEQGD